MPDQGRVVIGALPDDTGIRTPDQRLRVFVSSTLAELTDERRAVSRAISTLRLTPVMFELGARPHPPTELYRAYLAQSDIFIGLYWQSYGQVAPGMDVSGLEDEFALSGEIPRLLYVKTPAPDRDPRLAELLTRMKRETAYRRFRTAAELGRLVRDDLATLLSERFAATPRAAVAVGPTTPDRRRPLPAPTTPLVGREQAIEDVADLVLRRHVRLVTLTGPGGIGKTRLAIAVGERLREHFGDRTVFVPLAALMRPEMVLGDIGRAAGADLASRDAPLQALVDYFGDGEWLLILDNLEHLVDAARDLDELLAGCPGLAILATSLIVLRLRAEWVYPLEALTLPANPADVPLDELAASPAVALFVERARAVRHDFALSEGNAAAVAEICRRLEGMPLAIELAAARTRLLDPSSLLSRLSRSLDALGAGTVDMPERQHTLRATVEWSVGLLDAAELSLLETMAAFVDGWTIEAAAAVAGVDEDRVLDLTEALAGHSLIYLDTGDDGPRSRMLDTIREFVAERLAARPDVAEIRRRHADHYRALAEQADRPMRLGRQDEWAPRLQIERGNLTVAVRWYMDHDRGPLPNLFRVITPWAMRPFLGMPIDILREARSLIDEFMSEADALGAHDRAEVLTAAAVVGFEIGDEDPASAAVQDLAPLVPELDDPYVEAVARLVTSWSSAIAGDFDRGVREAAASLELFRRLGEPLWIPVALITLGPQEAAVGDYDHAALHLTEVRERAERVPNPWLTINAWVQLGMLELARERFDDAWASLSEALDLNLAEQQAPSLALCLSALAQLAFAEGDVEQAALLEGAADGLRRRAGIRVWGSARLEAERIALVREALGPDRFDELFAAGAGLSQQDAVTAARRRHGEGVRAS